MKILVVTDPHIVTAGEDIIGLDPSARLDGVLGHAMAHQGDAAHLVILGDLTHHGRTEEYAELKRLLAQVQMPVSLMLGNHDRRAAFLQAFPDAADEDGFVQQVVTFGDYRLICLDTLDEEAEPQHSGLLCDARLAWLRRALAACGDAPVLLALHHPPFLTGFDGMDAIRLRNDNALFEVIAEHGRVVQLLCGHVHRSISGSARGVPYAVFKSACHQMPMMLGAAGSSHSVDELGAYGIVLLGADGVTVHTEDVGDFGIPTADEYSA